MPGRVLVTGGTGAAGSATVKWLRRMGHDQADITFRMGRYKQRKGVLIAPKWLHKVDAMLIDLFVPEDLEAAPAPIRIFNNALSGLLSGVHKAASRLS